MGDGSYHELENLLAQKNAEVDSLNATLLVHSSRTSNLQSRLLQTLDVLDEIQRTHNIEVKELEHKYTRLERRTEKYRNVRDTLEAERDDLKDSVTELVGKIEQSNDIRSWPFSRLQISKFAGYARTTEPHPHPLNEEEQLAYAGAIIDRLRRERDDERAAHEHTRDSLQSRVDMLEAQLARREVELESYATHSTCVPAVLSGRNDVNVESKVDGGSKETPAGSSPLAPTVRPSDSRDANPSPSGQSLTNEAIINMLNTTAVRNRALEVEIKTLFKRLHQARSILSSPPGASVATVSPHPRTRNGVRTPQSHLNDPLSSSTKDDMISYGVNDYGITDGGGSVKDGIVDSDENQVHHDQQRRTRISHNTGPSRTRVHISPSGKALYDDHRSNRHHYKAKRPRKSSTQTEAHEDGTNQFQGLGTSNLWLQSPTSPVSDAIDDHHSIHGDNGDAIWRTTAPAISPGVRTNVDDVLLAQEHVSFAYGTGARETTIAVSNTNYADGPDPHAASLRRSRPRSATLAGLDVEIQELSSQIDAFRHEREKLSKFVANRPQAVGRGQAEEYIFPSHPFRIANHDDDQSLQADNVLKGSKEDPAAIHGDDQKEVQYPEGARSDTLDLLTQRLNIVEHECLQLRHELNEYRAISQSRESELTKEIQALQRRVNELSLLCNVPSSLILSAFQSEEHDVESTLDPTADGQDRTNSHRRLQDPHVLHPELDTLPTLSPALGVILDNGNEDGSRKSRLGSRDQTPNGGDLQTELQPLPVEPYIEIAEPPLVNPLPPQALSDARVSLLRLDDTGLDGLLDAIDGETSMELATPLIPTALLEHISSSPSPPCSDQENCDEQSDHDSGSEEMMLDDFQDQVGTQLQERHVAEQGRHLHYGETVQQKFELAAGEGGEDQFSITGVGGSVSGTAPEGISDESPCVDGVDVGATNRDDPHERSPSAPLLREGEPEDEFDDDGHSGADDDNEERQRIDRACEELVWQDGVDLDRGDPCDEYRGDRDEMVVVIPQSQTLSRTRDSVGTEASDSSPESRLGSESPHPRPLPSRPQTRSSPAVAEEALPAELILRRAEHELTVAQEMLEQGGNALRSVEASLSLELLSPRSPVA